MKFLFFSQKQYRKNKSSFDICSKLGNIITKWLFSPTLVFNHSPSTACIASCSMSGKMQMMTQDFLFGGHQNY
jgi:hypothetical protein